MVAMVVDHSIFWRMSRRAALCLALVLGGELAGAAEPADYVAQLAGDATEAPWLRRLTVEERVGEARESAVVRAPVFFAAGECADAGRLVVVDEAGEEQRIQIDDIRPGPDGGVARCTVWFRSDLPAQGRRTFFLRLRENSEQRVSAEAVAMQSSRDGPVISAGGARWRFNPQGKLREWTHPSGTTWSPKNGLGFELELAVGEIGSKAERQVVHLPEAGSFAPIETSAGPLFARVTARVRHEDVEVECTWRIFADGRRAQVIGAIRPEPGRSVLVRRQQWLVAELSKEEVKITEQPATLRDGEIGLNRLTVHGLSAPRGGQWLVVPTAWGGASGVVSRDGALVAVEGARGLSNRSEGADTQQGFWTGLELRWVGSDASVGAEMKRGIQPLVAVVDEPGATLETLHDLLADLAKRSKPVGWPQEAGRLVINDQVDTARKVIARGPRDWQQDADRLVASAKRARAAEIEKNGGRLPEHAKGRAAGALDPYDLTYTLSLAFVLAEAEGAPAESSAMRHAFAAASKEALGREDAQGHPYLDCFNRAANMQMGAVLAGITDGDPALADYYRRLVAAPGIRIVEGKAQRPYGAGGDGPRAYSDFLYQAIVDFWLRATEILADEDLGLHPLAYARYLDCVDVNADLYTAFDAKDTEGDGPMVRANFFRGQPHTHRWLAWSAAPYLRLLEHPGEDVGVTEAIHYTRAVRERWRNWPDLTFYIMADLLMRSDDGRLPVKF